MSNVMKADRKEQYVAAPINNQADFPGQVDGKEYKYERVETEKVDQLGNATMVDVREDRGKEDPGMNFVDARPPNVAPGAAIGVLPSFASGTPQNPIHNQPGSFYLTETNVVLGGSEASRIVGGPGGVAPMTVAVDESSPNASVLETTTIKKKKSVNI
jgi:hypothetical protein